MNNKIYDIDFTKYNRVHPATEEDARILIAKAYESGYGWMSSDKNETHWDVYERDTVYYFNEGKLIMYGDVSRFDFDDGYTCTTYPFTEPQPRICDILGVEVGEQFTIEGCNAQFEILSDGHYRTTPAKVPNSSYAFLDAIQNPRLVHKVPACKLSEKDKEFFQMIYDRMGDGEINTLNNLYLRILFDRDTYSCVDMAYDTFDTKFERNKTYKLSEVIE